MKEYPIRIDQDIVVDHIYKLLNFSERLSFSLTCKYYKELMYEKALKDVSKDIITRLEMILNPEIATLLQEHCMLTGGFLLSIIYQTEKYGDIDLAMKDCSVRELSNIFKSRWYCLTSKSIRLGLCCKLYEMDITNTQLDIVGLDYLTSFERYIDTFDFDFCKVGYHKGVLKICNIEALTGKRTIINQETIKRLIPDGYPMLQCTLCMKNRNIYCMYMIMKRYCLRIQKYIDRGFSVIQNLTDLEVLNETIKFLIIPKTTRILSACVSVLEFNQEGKCIIAWDEYKRISMNNSF